MNACAEGNIKQAKQLLEVIENLEDPDFKNRLLEESLLKADENGNTPLSKMFDKAIRTKNPKVIRLLIEKCGDQLKSEKNKSIFGKKSMMKLVNMLTPNKNETRGDIQDQYMWFTKEKRLCLEAVFNVASDNQIEIPEPVVTRATENVEVYKKLRGRSLTVTDSTSTRTLKFLQKFHNDHYKNLN